MTRTELVEMIREEIQSLAFETLKTSSEEKKKSERSRTYKPKGLSEEELEQAVFYGGNRPSDDDDISKIISTNIKESYNSGIPQVKESEIIEFEDSFDNMLSQVDGASVVFDTQSNGYSLMMSVGKDGIEAGASGIIHMGRDGQLKFSYSLKNGLTVSADDLLINSGNKMLIEKLYSHYNAWQKDWREKLTIVPAEPGQEEPMPEPQPEEVPEPGAAPEGGAGEEPTA